MLDLTKRNDTLFNCCTGNLPPDWSQFDAIEVRPCASEPQGRNTGETFTEPCEPHEADIWTVYGHCTWGGVEAITDASTQRLAELIAALFENELHRRGHLKFPTYTAHTAQ